MTSAYFDEKLSASYVEYCSALKSGDTDLAERIVATQLSHDDSCFWLTAQGELLVLQGRFADALAAFDRAAQKDPHDLAPVLCGAVVLADLGFYDEAKVRFDCAQFLDGEAGSRSLKAQASAHAREAARLWERAGLFRESHDEWTRSQDLDPTFTTTLSQAYLYFKENKTTESQKQLSLISLKDFQESAATQILRSQHLLMGGHKQEALQALAQAKLLRDVSQCAEVLRHMAQHQER